MSFVHYTFLGHFDLDAAALGRLVVTQSLDAALASRLFAEAGAPVGPDGLAQIERDRFGVGGGYVVSRGVVRSARAAEFIAHFTRVAGCEILDWETKTTSTPEDFLAYFAEIDEYRAERRRKARERRQGSGPLP